MECSSATPKNYVLNRQRNLEGVKFNLACLGLGLSAFVFTIGNLSFSSESYPRESQNQQSPKEVERRYGQLYPWIQFNNLSHEEKNN